MCGFGNCLECSRIISERGPAGTNGTNGTNGTTLSWVYSDVSDYGTGLGPAITSNYDVTITNSSPSGTNIIFFGRIFVEATIGDGFVSATPMANAVVDNSQVIQETFPAAVAGKTYVTLALSGHGAVAAGQSFKIRLLSNATNAKLRNYQFQFITI